MAANGEPAWTITTQVETVDLGPAGNFLQGVKVGFRTRRGFIGSVFLPADAYTVERVRAAVAERAAAMDAAGELTG